MPKITPTASAKGRLVMYLDARVLSAYQASLQRAADAGLRVDVSRDFESLLRRLTKVIDDAVEESASSATVATAQSAPSDLL